MEGFGEHGNEPPSSVKCWEILSSFTIGGYTRTAQVHEV
jgi:hypothetical protein